MRTRLGLLFLALLPVLVMGPSASTARETKKPSERYAEKERKFVKDLLTELSQRSPHIKGNLLASLGQVHLSHLLDKRYNPNLAATRPEAVGLNILNDLAADPS